MLIQMPPTNNLLWNFLGGILTSHPSEKQISTVCLASHTCGSFWVILKLLHVVLAYPTKRLKG